MSHGFTLPYSPSGRSALVVEPPWHYAGSVMSFETEVGASVAAEFLPAGFGRATGRAFGHFCEWQATTDGSELLDPVYAQYKEFFLLIEAQGSDGRRLFCPFIYVDQDISMMRGLLQGWPKKFGSIWITRSYDLEHPAAAQRSAGARLGASVAVKDRRLAEADLTLTGEAVDPIGFLAIPTFGLIAAPSLVGGADRGTARLVRQQVATSVLGPVHGANGELRMFAGPRDELSLLSPLRTVRSTVCDFALTVTGVQDAT